MKIPIYTIMMIMLSTQLSTTTLFAAKTRSAEPVTFSTKTMALTIAPDASVILTRDGKVVSDPKSPGWSIYCWTDCPTDVRNGGTRTQLDNMAKIGPNELLLWSSEKHFEVKVAITPKDRYFTFELLHVSNDAKTGGLNRDWQGHRVEFELQIDKQPDGWGFRQLKLNPMTELRFEKGSNSKISFHWPYVYWAQEDDRPQPQGAIAFYGYIGDEEHDDILTDIWVGEPSLPRPNRANLTSWTRSDVQAWLDRWISEQAGPWVTVSFATHGKGENLYKMADVAEKTAINRIYLHHYEWQGESVGLPNGRFPNGLSDVDKWREYCDDRGVKIKLHGFGGLYRNHDIKFGPQYKPDGLVRSARGHVVSDVAENEKTFLVKPDLSLYPWLKPGMPPFATLESQPWGHSGRAGSHFPPYFEKTMCEARINNIMYDYSYKITKDNMWEITLKKGTEDKSTFKAGDLVEFIVNGSGAWRLPDPRSKMYEEMAKDYANILNHFQSNDLYDGGGMCQTYGHWAIDKMTQMVFEHLDHPVYCKRGSIFGHFDMNFRQIQKYTDLPTSIPMCIDEPASYATSPDDINFTCSLNVKKTNFGIRGNHRGIYIEDIEALGVWDMALKAISFWTKLKPHLSEEQKSVIGKKRKNTDFFEPSETATEWHLTKTRAMRRKDERFWPFIPERPPVAPRQFLKADSKAIKGLENPYTTQTTDIQLHVMASMKSADQKNIPLMVKDKKDITFTLGKTPKWSAYEQNTYNQVRAKDAAISWDFRNGALELSVDNSRSDEPYLFKTSYGSRYKKSPIATWPSSATNNANERGVINTSKHRGVAITVVGDGSGSVLFVRVGHKWGRIYPVEVDFVGKRTIEIPSGEAHLTRYGFVGAITAGGYRKVDEMSAWIVSVPEGKKANVKILDIQAMSEDHTMGLTDPVLTLNDQSIQITGTVPYNHYLTYTYGPVAKVYGPNWHFVKDVAVTANESFVAVKGSNTFSVKATKSPDAFLSCRIKVRDANRITIQKPSSAPPSS